jgi:hypothetical protein
MPNTPDTDAEEARQRESYENMREAGWPAFFGDFDFARRLEIERDQLKTRLKAWTTSSLNFPNKQ